jgi:hypothetical protein
LGRLSKYRAARVDEHVLSCRDCRKRLETGNRDRGGDAFGGGDQGGGDEGGGED